jgi:putative hydrolase of the HAD superfamily
LERRNGKFSSGPETIRAVIFDFGEVLCHRGPREDFAPLAKILRLTPERFVERYRQNRLPYDRGDLTAEQYWRGFARETGHTLTDDEVAELGRGDVSLWRRMDPVLLNWVARLRAAGIRTGVLSNMFIALATELRKSAPWLASFDAHTYSAEIRLTKPHPEIYRHNLRQMGVSETEALFLDDREENVAGARAVGMQGLLYTNAQSLTQDLKEWGFAILPAAHGPSA